MNGSYTYKSQFLPHVTIMIVTDEYPGYEDLRPIFDQLGYGFMVPNKDTIIIDGEILSGSIVLLTKTLTGKRVVVLPEIS